MTANTDGAYIGTHVIRVQDLSFAYDNKKILDNVSLDITKGEKVAILGNNGCGKSTLLNCIYEKLDGVHIPKGIDIGYFKQNTLDLDDTVTIVDSIMKYSKLPEHMTK